MSHRTPSLHFNGQQSDGIQIPYSPCKVSMNNLSCEQVRANIVQEIVATERDYVKHLKDVVEVSLNFIYYEKCILLMQGSQQLYIKLFLLYYCT